MSENCGGCADCNTTCNDAPKEEKKKFGGLNLNLNEWKLKQKTRDDVQMLGEHTSKLGEMMVILGTLHGEIDETAENEMFGYAAVMAEEIVDALGKYAEIMGERQKSGDNEVGKAMMTYVNALHSVLEENKRAGNDTPDQGQLRELLRAKLAKTMPAKKSAADALAAATSVDVPEASPRNYEDESRYYV